MTEYSVPFSVNLEIPLMDSNTRRIAMDTAALMFSSTPDGSGERISPQDMPPDYAQIEAERILSISEPSARLAEIRRLLEALIAIASGAVHVSKWAVDAGDFLDQLPKRLAVLKHARLDSSGPTDNSRN